MNYKNLFWGVILIALGVLYLLKQLDIIWFNWRDIVSLWPLLLVLWGISLLPIKPAIKLISSLIAVVVMVLIIYNNPGRWHSGWFWIGSNDRTETRKSQKQESIKEASGLARLELNAAAGTYTIEGLTDELVDFTHVGDSGAYYMRTTVDENTHHVFIGPEHGRNQFNLYNSHEVDIKLNGGMRWELDIDAGAAKISLDLREYIVDQLNIQGGATSMDIILGSLSENLDVNIETGVSTVSIEVPEEVACEVNTDSFLVSKSIKGFDKVSKSTYVSPNYSDAGKNITINFDSGISSLSIVRY